MIQQSLRVLAGILCMSGASLLAQEDRKIDFEKDVLPVFDTHCVRCHGASKQTADVRLDLRSAILKGGGSGEIIRVGNSAASMLIDLVTQPDLDLRMPPEGSPLSEAEVGLLKAWINQGAQGPEDSHLLNKALPWSFQPVTRPQIAPTDSPTVSLSVSPTDSQLDSQSTVGYGPIDRFLATSLATKGLRFSDAAERETLIRRLYLVALGVPPTIQEVDAFLQDVNPDAYDRLVDRVLSDPRYGERLARHWFDVIRFAESNGFETNRVRYSAWPFRDYVIGSFNSDKPYDQFIREQIAGDELGVEVGTGFLVAGPYDLVKSPDESLTLMQRQDELADLINTTGTAFMGLTLGCARCHDHKFDPVTQKDFYALQGVFAGVQFGERELANELNDQSRARNEQIKVELKRIEGAVEAWRVKSAARMSEKKLRPAVEFTVNEEQFEPVRALSVRFTILASGGSQPCIDEWEVLREDGVNVGAASRGAKASASSTLPGYAIHKLEHINDEKVGNSHSWISNEADGGVMRIDFAEPSVIRSMRWGRDRMGQFRDRVASAYKIEALLEDGQWRVVATGADRISAAGSDPQGWVLGLEEGDQEQASSLLANLKALQGEQRGLLRGQAAWIGTFREPSEVYRLYRGDPMLKREKVSPGVVESLASIDGSPWGATRPQVSEPSGADQAVAVESGSDTDRMTERQRRIALAHWVSSKHNPLTARVMANRLWQMVFGVGIVDTPSDFGGNGSKPVHPELLDWLASELIDSGWSIKHLHRQMFQSLAFRQSSLPREDGLAADADGRLMWRFSPRRLEAEAIRDSMLVASDVMDYRMGGPGFYLQRVEQDNVYRYFPKEEVGPAEYRRMVYLTRIRQEQDPVFGVFDCPSGNQVIAKRARSNTPLQALNLFNSPFVLQQSKLIVQRLDREVGGGTNADVQLDKQTALVEKIRLAFRWLMAREPDRWEVEMSEAFVKREGIESFCRAMLNASEFLFVF